MASYAELVPILCLLVVMILATLIGIGFLVYTIYKDRKKTDYDEYVKNSEPW